MVNPCYSKSSGVHREKERFGRTSGTVILTEVDDFSDGICFRGHSLIRTMVKITLSGV